jgi:5-formyltetrahydrofolate cyclo-ligase
MNLYEPQGADFSSPLSIELAIVPGIAFDRRGHRMGRGGGFYDRLLPNLRAFNIGVCFSFQMFDTIPSAAHDIAMDRVVTETGDDVVR